MYGTNDILNHEFYMEIHCFPEITMDADERLEANTATEMIGGKNIKS